MKKNLSDLYEGVPEAFAKVMEQKGNDVMKDEKKLSSSVNDVAQKKAANTPKTPNGLPVKWIKNGYNGDKWSKELTD